MDMNEQLLALAEEWEAKAGEVDRPTEPAVSYVEAARLLAGITLRDCAKGLRALITAAPVAAPASPEAPAPDAVALFDAAFSCGYHAGRGEGDDAAADAARAAISRAVSEARREAEKERSRLSLLVHDYGKEANALASRVSALEGALQECIEREYYDGQMDPARAALSAPAPRVSPPGYERPAPAPGDATACHLPRCRTGMLLDLNGRDEVSCPYCDGTLPRPAPAAGSPDTRTLGKDEGEPAGAPSENTNPGRRPAHMKNEEE